MRDATYPSLYQINTRVGMTELPRKLRGQATLDNVPDAEIDRQRQRLQKRGLRLMLNFVPNYTGLDHSIASCGC